MRNRIFAGIRRAAQTKMEMMLLKALHGTVVLLLAKNLFFLEQKLTQSASVNFIYCHICCYKLTLLKFHSAQLSLASCGHQRKQRNVTFLKIKSCTLTI